MIKEATIQRSWQLPGLSTTLLVSFVVLHVLDAVITVMGVSSGEAREANPIMRYVAQGSVPTFFAIKIGGALFIDLMLFRIARESLGLANKLLIGLVLVTVAICTFNLVAWYV